MERRWFAKWVQMCVAVNYYKVTDKFKCSRGERKDWLNRFNVPLSSLDSFLSCLGLITTHTHLTLLFHLHHNYCGEDWEQSKAHMRPSTAKHPHMYAYACIYMNTHKRAHAHSHHNSIPINIFCLNLPVYSQIPPPSPGASCFWDWFHLFNDGCANDPSHVADGVTDTTTTQEWGLDGSLESEGWVILKRAERNWRSAAEGWGELVVPCMQAVFAFLKQTRTPDAE